MTTIILSAQLVHIVLAAVAVMAFVGANGLVLVYMERKLAGHIQRRPGPYEVGWHGVLQPFVDAGKLVGKQLITPDGADPLLYWLAPVVAFADGATTPAAHIGVKLVQKTSGALT